MKKLLSTLILAMALPTMGIAQNTTADEQFEKEVDSIALNFKKIELGINTYLYQQIPNLKNTTTITALENRFATQLNSIAACALLYEFSNTSLINSTEKKAIKKRMYQIADGFIANNTYIVLQTSAGIAPTYGITETTEKGKKVITLFLGGDCLISNHEAQLETFYNLFNQYMKKKL